MFATWKSLCKVSQEETTLGFRRAGLRLQPTHPQATSDRIIELLTFLVFALYNTCNTHSLRDWEMKGVISVEYFENKIFFINGKTISFVAINDGY